jgi:hypothetical protein
MAPMTVRSRAARAIPPRPEWRWMLTGSSRRRDEDLKVWSYSELSTERHNGEWPSGHRLTSQEYRARRTSLQELRPEQRHELPTKVLQAGRNVLAEARGRRSASGTSSQRAWTAPCLRCPLRERHRRKAGYRKLAAAVALVELPARTRRPVRCAAPRSTPSALATGDEEHLIDDGGKHVSVGDTVPVPGTWQGQTGTTKPTVDGGESPARRLPCGVRAAPSPAGTSRWRYRKPGPTRCTAARSRPGTSSRRKLTTRQHATS